MIGCPSAPPARILNGDTHPFRRGFWILNGDTHPPAGLNGDTHPFRTLREDTHPPGTLNGGL